MRSTEGRAAVPDRRRRRSGSCRTARPPGAARCERLPGALRLPRRLRLAGGRTDVGQNCGVAIRALRVTAVASARKESHSFANRITRRHADDCGVGKWQRPCPIPDEERQHDHGGQQSRTEVNGPQKPSLGVSVLHHAQRPYIRAATKTGTRTRSNAKVAGRFISRRSFLVGNMRCCSQYSMK